MTDEADALAGGDPQGEADAGLPELHAVVEAPWLDNGRKPWPWPVAERAAFSFIRLSGEMSDLDVGLVMAQLWDYNFHEDEDCDFSVAALLEAETIHEGLLLPGGIQASGGGREIDPGCCGGLENWRGWLEFVASGISPFMGHDPWPDLLWVGDIARVRGDRGDPKAFIIDFTRARLISELERVHRDLCAFLPRVAGWAETIGLEDAPLLCRVLDRCLKLSN